MDEIQAFSEEMFFKMLTNQLKDHTDLLNLLYQTAIEEKKESKLSYSYITAIKKDTEQIISKLDVVLEKLDDLESEFLDLKNENREIEQKLILMTSKLTRIEDSLGEEELEDYYGLCQSIYDNWDELEDLTRRLIPVAEFLFSKLQKYKKPDYSPVILELCKAIETEFLFKLFSKYTLDLLGRKTRTLDSFLSGDMSSSFLKNKTGMFVKAISRASRTNKPEFTLGQMNTIMSIMNQDNVVAASPLLQDFKTYLECQTVVHDLLNVQYIRKINDLVDKYRNPSAHPRLMTLEEAKECREIMPERLDYFMDCLVQ